ncbi:hypothetical protein U9M48_032370 [Paspalum notatum var. saurae]|uniref:Integrase catalytic domain-containing protein n=1 Tax=Paspalum notatum var. saurae TaxID=547442 RepID=A0AAQ3U4Y3_PASNO
MKCEVAEYVALCDVCQRVKAEHQKPAGLLQLLKIPEWKWEEIGMDFILGLPRTQSGFDSIWVVVDRLTKVAHFIPVKTTYSGAKLAELYMSRIVCLHGVPKKIVFDHGTQFTSHFWKRLHESMDTKLNFSSAYHPQTDRQTEKTNQILEDMLRACAIQYGFVWYTVQDAFALGSTCPKIIENAERQVQMIRENLRIAQTRQKSYADHRRRDLEFTVDDLNVQDDLSYTKYPVQILETTERTTTNSVIKMCKVKWSHHTAEEATWKRENDLRADYLELFASQS